MGRITKFRAPQTRASEEYDVYGDNLATDKEVEKRVRKHSALFHHYRDENSSFVFDSEDNLSQIITKNLNSDTITTVDFSFVDGVLNKLTKNIYDETLDSYVTLEKTFIFDNGSLSTIENRVL